MKLVSPSSAAARGRAGGRARRPRPPRRGSCRRSRRRTVGRLERGDRLAHDHHSSACSSASSSPSSRRPGGQHHQVTVGVGIGVEHRASSARRATRRRPRRRAARGCVRTATGPGGRGRRSLRPLGDGLDVGGAPARPEVIEARRPSYRSVRCGERRRPRSRSTKSSTLTPRSTSPPRGLTPTVPCSTSSSPTTST